MVGGIDVLVVDDDQAIAEFLEVILRDKGYRVRTALSGQQAVALFETSKPSVVLLDLMLSATSGSDLARTLRHSATSKDVPIVVMSAHDDLLAMADSIGAAGCLRKPFDLDELFSNVARFAGARD